jgi:hypothetical protein
MLAAALVFGMEPSGAVTVPTYDSGTPTVLTLWPGRGGVWCACSLSGRRVGVVHDAGGGLGCLVWSRAVWLLPQLMIQAPP